MKHIITLAIILAVAISLEAQNVGINTPNPHLSSELDVTSTSKGFLAPRMTQAQRNAISSPATGLLVFQTDDITGFYYYNGTAWTIMSNTAGVFTNSGNTLIKYRNPSDFGLNLVINASDPYFFGSPGDEIYEKLVFNPTKWGAFQAGRISNYNWNEENVGEGSFAIGNNSLASGTNSISIGNSNVVSGYGASAFGAYNYSTQFASFALGYNNSASGNYSIAIGNQSSTASTASVAFGDQDSVVATAEAGIAMGSKARAIGKYSTALGRFTRSTGYASTSLGDSTDASGNISWAAGYRSRALGNYSIAIGDQSSTTVNAEGSNAIGSFAVAGNKYATSTGRYTQALGYASVGIGDSVRAIGDYSVAIGYRDTATGKSSIALGLRSHAQSDNSIAIGEANTATSSIVIGGRSRVIGAANNKVIAIGDTIMIQSNQNGIYLGGLTNSSYCVNCYSIYGTQLGETYTQNSFLIVGYYGFLKPVVEGSFSTGLGGSNFSIPATLSGNFIMADHVGLSYSGLKPELIPTVDNQMLMRFQGGYRLFSNTILTAGVLLNPGQNGWSTVSDSNKKENFVAPQDFLGKIAKMQLGSWNYKGQDKSIRHYGPYAQEFYKYFGNDGIGKIGNDSTLISTDVDGVLMIALKQLAQANDVVRLDINQQNETLTARIGKVKKENQLLSAEIDFKIQNLSAQKEALKERITLLTQSSQTNNALKTDGSDYQTKSPKEN
ncbi:MAG: tail fiber domain-containing protein [Chitinophagaceae bacterium]|nr:tail fiber domain-containing protein [Chitinophagaceae bacterium]